MKLIVIKKNYKFLIGSSKQRVLEVLFRYPDKEFSLTELAKLAKIAKANIGIILNELQKSGFLEITRLSNLWRVKANQKSWNFIRAKIVYNLNFVYQSGLVEFLADNFKNPKSIVLFGSFRKGEDISGSDIDIAIENDSLKDNEIISLRELSEFEKIIERKIQIHLFNRDKININVFNNIANGIVLSGFLEVKK
jgi:predicted nucleotidyltransferase/DNA-binding MarR family transcriptional regulator